MRKHFLAFLLIIFALALQAQRPEPVSYSSRPNIGTITAVVIDSQSNSVLPYATIALYLLPQDSLVSGTMANDKGKIVLSNVKLGIYKAVIGFVGYDDKIISKVRIGRNQPIVDLGKVKLTSTSEQLKAAEIKAKRNFMTLDIDRKTYDVEKNIISEGGSATEVLQNIPSVDVDIDGNISLRGSGNLRILIDGKPSGLTGSSRQAILEQIPAASISSIEVITNPSAKYDPEGTAGIINIKLKKNLEQGLNGSISGGLGTFYKYNGNAELNFRSDKVHLFASVNRRYNDSWSQGKNFRVNDFADTTTFLRERSDRIRTRTNNFARLGMEYLFGAKSSLNLSANYGLEPSSSVRTTLYSSFDEDSVLKEVQAVTSFNNEEEDNLDLNLFFNQELNTDISQKFSLQARYSLNTEYERTDLINWDVSNENGFRLNMSANDEPQSYGMLLFQGDYEQKLSQSGKFEAGFRSTIQDIDQGFNFWDENPVNDALELDSSKSSRFIYNEDIHAAYAIIGSKKGWLQYQFGLRAEMALTNSQLEGDTGRWVNNYNSLYPSVHLSKQIREEEEVMVSYSRRVNRPRTRALNPFQDYSNPLNIRIGNPYLRPEYINSIEIGYSKRWNDVIMMNTSLYYRITTDVIRRIRTVDEQSGISTLSFQNLDNAQDAGIEMLVIIDPARWWSIQLSGNGFQTWIDASNVETDLTNSGLGFTGKANNQIQLNKKIDIQISTRWRAPGVTTQGQFNGYITTDFAIKYSLPDRRGSISLRISDVFDQRQWAYYSEGSNFSSDGVWKRQSRVIFLNATYRFGKQQRDERKRQGGDRGMDDFIEE